MAQPPRPSSQLAQPTLDPAAACDDIAQFEQMIQAQLNAQAHHNRVRMRREQPHVVTMDPTAASRALHSAGALKNYKPDRVVANSKLDALTTSQLTVMLKQQRQMAANDHLLKSLPDGGAKVHAQLKAIEQQLEQRRAQEETQMEEVADMMQEVRFEEKKGREVPPGGVGEPQLSETQNGAAASASAAAAAASPVPAALSGPRPVSGSAAAPSSSSSSSSSAASSSAAAAGSRFPTPPSSSPYRALGRSGAVTAVHCTADAVNARIARERQANIESKFRRAPPIMLQAEEANRLLREKVDEWHSHATLFASGGGGGSGAPSMRATQARAEEQQQQQQEEEEDDDDELEEDFEFSDGELDEED